jgi:predicted HicB family RNase H-like nuclease
MKRSTGPKKVMSGKVPLHFFDAVRKKAESEGSNLNRYVIAAVEEKSGIKCEA